MLRRCWHTTVTLSNPTRLIRLWCCTKRETTILPLSRGIIIDDATWPAPGCVVSLPSDFSLFRRTQLGNCMIGILVGTSTTYNNLVESVLRLSPIGWNLESGIYPPRIRTAPYVRIQLLLLPHLTSEKHTHTQRLWRNWFFSAILD